MSHRIWTLCRIGYLQDLTQDDETEQEQHGLLNLLFRRVQEAQLRHQTRMYLFVSNALLTNARTAQQRLGNESMRRFDACALYLQRARDPVACQKGHLFCRECVLTDLGAFAGQQYSLSCPGVSVPMSYYVVQTLVIGVAC